MTEGADIRSLGAFYIQDILCVREFVNTYGMDYYRSCLTLNNLALSGKFIKFFALNFKCRIHRRNLLQFSHEFATDRFDSLSIGNILALGQHLTRNILCIGLPLIDLIARAVIAAYSFL